LKIVINYYAYVVNWLYIVTKIATAVHLSPFILERHFAKYEFDVPFQLSCSDCEPLGMGELLSMASPETFRLWENLRLSYTESPGHPLLRYEIAEFCEDLNPEDILICVPEEGIFLVMSSLLEKGDHIVVISPAYQSLYEIAKASGCQVSLWNPEIDGTYQIDGLKSFVQEKTRMVVINFPHNPSGSFITKDELVEIAQFCLSRGVILFSDEMYRGLEQDSYTRLPCASGLNNNCISLSGLSKSFALPGLRIGWLSCQDRRIREKLTQLKDYTTICSSAPSEILGIIALQNQERILDRNLTIIRHNIELVNQLVQRNPSMVSWNPPVAGSVALLNLLKEDHPDALCRKMLECKDVLAIGSHLFNSPKPAIRLGLGRIDFGAALERFEEIF
jgi:aspartate/methionine/tyrosine aminotransferase